MKSFVRRLAADLATTWGYLAAAAALTAVLTLTVALFAEENPRLPSAPWREASPVSLRIADADTALVTEYTSREELDASPLDFPAAQALRTAVADDERVYLAPDLFALIAGHELPNCRLLIGPKPAGLPTEPGTLLLWGATPSEAEVVSAALGLPARLAGPSFSVLDGTGDEIVTDFLITVDWDTFGQLTHAPTKRAEFMTSAVCIGCDVAEWQALAATLTRADRAAGANVVYFAGASTDLISPSDQLYALTNLLDRVELGAAWLAGLVAAVAGSAALWRKRAAAFLIDLSQGAGRWHLHARTQSLVALGVTFPMLAALVALKLLWAALNVASLVPEDQRLAPFALVPAVHVIVGAATAVRAEMLLRRMG